MIRRSPVARTFNYTRSRTLEGRGSIQSSTSLPTLESWRLGVRVLLPRGDLRRAWVRRAQWVKSVTAARAFNHGVVLAVNPPVDSSYSQPPPAAGATATPLAPLF